MRRAGSGLVLWLFLVSGAWFSGSAERPLDLPELPKIALDNLAPPVRTVIQEAYDAVVAHPRDASTNARLGMALHAYSFFREAEVCYRRAHLLDPASFRWAYYLGSAQADAGHWGDAAATFREAARLNPEYLPMQLKWGGCLLASGRWQEAAEVYEAILEKHPDSAAAHYGLGRVRAVRKDLEGAVESFRKASQLFPDYGAVHYALAHTCKRLGKMDQAVEYLTLYQRNKTSGPNVEDQLWDELRALNVNPADQMRLGMELGRRGKWAEAAAALEKALRINPQLVEVHVSLISLYARLAQFDKSEEHFQAAVRLDPNGPASYFNHGLLFASQGRFPEGEGEFRKTLEINPVYPGARTNLGYALEAQEKLPEATAEFRKAIESNPEDFQAHFGLGRILVNQESYQAGIQHLLKCLDTPNEDSKPAYLYALGAAYARAGDLKSGLHYLRLARQKAEARRQSELAESIAEDLKLLNAEGVSR